MNTSGEIQIPRLALDWLSFWNSHDHAVVNVLSILPDLRNLEPSFVNEGPPFDLRTFRGSQTRHHGHVQLRRPPMDVTLGEHHLIDQNDRFRSHGGLEILQDLDALVVREVVENVAEVVGAGTWKQFSFSAEQLRWGGSFWVIDYQSRYLTYL